MGPGITSILHIPYEGCRCGRIYEKGNQMYPLSQGLTHNGIDITHLTNEYPLSRGYRVRMSLCWLVDMVLPCEG